MIVHGVVAVHREDLAKRVSVNGVNSNIINPYGSFFRIIFSCKTDSIAV